MLVTCGLILLILKYLVWPNRSAVAEAATRRDRFAFYFLWPGLDVAAFLDQPTNGSLPTRLTDWTAATLKIALGSILFWGVLPIYANANPWLLGISGMLSAILFLHCGVFHLVALAWRAAGRRVVPIMNRPLAANSLSEFWSERWNLAFRDAAARLVFRPAARRRGMIIALLLTYLFSGLIHDAAISFPARGGYGLPTLYFLLQGIGILGQRELLNRFGGSWKSIVGRLTTLAVVVVPMPLLFHRPFAEYVVLPLMNAVGVF